MALQKQKYHHHKHIPVLLEDTIKMLQPATDEWYLDLTAGYGGHARAVLGLTNAPRNMVLVDRDKQALDSLEDLRILGVNLIHASMVDALEHKLQGRSFNMILMDLGVSSVHLDTAERGFSFTREGPLDMRMDQSQVLNAAIVINEWPEKKLVQIIKDYGEEYRAQEITQAIMKARPIGSTIELAEIVKKAIKTKSYQKVHPATKTFQAIRIAVNDEVNQLQSTLSQVVNILKPNGRLAVISFHSLEDRIVKNYFKQESSSGYESKFILLTKKPIRGDINDVHNPRARSAKLRVVVKK